MSDFQKNTCGKICIFQIFFLSLYAERGRENYPHTNHLPILFLIIYSK